MLVCIKLLSFNDTEYRNKMRSIIAKQYQKRFKNSLNKKEIEKYTALQVGSRNAVLVFFGFILIVIEILIKF